MIRTKEDVSVELGQRLQASCECDEIAPKDAIPVKVNASPKVLPCLAFDAEHSIVNSKHFEVIKQMHKQVDSHSFSALAALLALLSLEFKNLRLITAGTPFDNLLELVLFCSLAVFVVEFLVRCAAEEDYCWSAWFLLDMIAVATLLMEIRWFQDFAFTVDCHMISPASDHYAHVGGQAAHALRVAKVLRVLRFCRLIMLCRPVFRLAVCRSFWHKINPLQDSVAAKVAEDEWFQGVFQTSFCTV